MPSLDVHQHLWPEAVLRVLERRDAAPRAVWREARWEVQLPGEPSFDVDPADHDPERRAGELTVDRALLALSSPVGIEALPQRDALAALTAWHEAVPSFAASFGWWAFTPSAFPVEEQAEIARHAIADGAAGVCLPAGRLATPTHAVQLLPLLEAVAESGAPLFVHPGPASSRPAVDSEWWAPATDYVAQQHAAWHSFHAVIRPQLPALRVIFAILAGLAPLHAERTALRGGPFAVTALDDPLCFYDTSSYGPRAVRAVVTAVGAGQLVHGTDHPSCPPAADPVIEALGEGYAELVRRDGPARALGYAWVPA